MESKKELKNKKVVFELIPLNQVVHSVNDVQTACKCEVSEIIKTLVFTIGNNPVIIILPGNKRANIAKIENILGEKGLRMAKPDEVKKFTGYIVGSVSPFGIEPKIKQIADNSILNLSSLLFGSGENDVIIKISRTEFSKAFEGIFAQISD